MGEKQYSRGQVANTSGKNPKSFFNEDDFALMSVDELWDIYQKAEAILAKKIATELDELKRRLAQLGAEVQSGPRTHRKTQNDIRNAARIRRCCRNIKILRNRPRLGPVAEGCRGGLPRSSARERRSTIFGSSSPNLLTSTSSSHG